MRKKKQTKERKFQLSFDYRLEEIICDANDQEEVDYLIPYMGRYVLRRMTFGDHRLAESSMVKIQTRVKGKDVDIEDVIPDISNWQTTILTYSIYECPYGKRPLQGWKDDKGVMEFIYNMPNELGSELLDVAMELNNLSEDETKN